MTDNANKHLISELEAEYDQEEGFLGLLRGGHFDTRARDRFLRLLDSVDLGPGEMISRRLVALLWYVPLLLQWQARRLDEEERVALQEVIDQVTNQLERVLGVP
jgi:hypothetical protein